MTMTCSGMSLTDVANRLMARLKGNPRDAEALMDLAVISHLWFKHDIGLATQAQALKIKRLYQLPANGSTRVRLLALMHHGDLAANTPLEFIVQGSDIALDMLYLDPAQGLPADLPEHDLLFVAVGESARSRPLLQLLAQQLSNYKRPLLNRPERIARLSRDSVGAMLQALPGIDMPLSAQISRAALAQLGDDSLALTDLLADGSYPLIVRPVDSHAGQGLVKIDAPGELAAYLQAWPEPTFFLSRFVDYRNADGLYRKYRVVLVDGLAYAGHMAISGHWMIHYLNAHMSASQKKRDEEARFMQDFDTAFGARNRQALQAIRQAAGLDYPGDRLRRSARWPLAGIRDR